MKTRRQLFCLFLTLLMLCSSMPIANAAESRTDANDDFTDFHADKAVILRSQGDEYYTIAENRSLIGANAVKTIAASPYRNYKDVLVSKTGEFFFSPDGKNYIIASCISLPLEKYSTYQELNSYALPDAVIAGVAQMAALAEETNSTNAYVELFVPKNTANISSADGSNIRSTRGNTATYSTTWNNSTFNHYTIYFSNLNTTWKTISSGTSITEAVLVTIKEATLLGAGGTVLGTIASIFSSGSNCLNAWKDAFNLTPIYGASGNAIQANINYDLNLKYTYWVDPKGTEILGCATQRVYVKTIETDTFLNSAAGGKRLRETKSVYLPYDSPRFANPEPTAFTGSGLVERVRYKIYNKTLYFGVPSFNWPSNWP